MSQQQPLELSDESMDLLFRLAGPLSPDDRSLFLQRVAQELQGQELSHSAVHRVAARVPRDFYRPPDLGHHYVSRWSSRRGNGVGG